MSTVLINLVLINLMSRVKILFVCMGNICRSPTAEGVFRHKVKQAGLEDLIHIDSAGTHAYHVGESPDNRAQGAARSRGVDLSTQRARKVNRNDFDEFDFVIAMDNSNYYDLESISEPHHQEKLYLFLDFARNASVSEVPDPYYGGNQGFENVLDLVEDASDGLIDHLKQKGYIN